MSKKYKLNLCYSAVPLTGSVNRYSVPLRSVTYLKPVTGYTRAHEWWP
jgi:hypothetical protein